MLTPHLPSNITTVQCWQSATDISNINKKLHLYSTFLNKVTLFFTDDKSTKVEENKIKYVKTKEIEQ